MNRVPFGRSKAANGAVKDVSRAALGLDVAA